MVCLSACDPTGGAGGCGDPGLDPNTSLVERGTASGTPGVVFTTLDNPNIHFNEFLQYVPTDDGPRSQEVFATQSPDNFRFSKSDFLVLTSGGLPAPNKGNGGSLNVGSVNDVLFPWPNQAGYWTTADITPDGHVPFDTHAVRIGHKALSITLEQTLPDGSHRLGALPFDVALDPKVALVPIEVIIPFTKNFPQIGKRLAYQKMLWDLESTFTSNTRITVATASGFELSAIERGWANWVNRDGAGHYLVKQVETNPPTTLGSQEFAAPDSVFDRCNIQFRLAHYVEFEAPDDSYVVPTDAVCTTGGDNEPMKRVVGEADTRGLLINGPIRVVFMERCTCPLALGLSTNEGGSRYNSGVLCAGPNSAPLILSHELGHALGLACEAYSSVGQGQCTYAATATDCAPGFSLMCAVPGDPSTIECDSLHTAALSLSSTAGW